MVSEINVWVWLSLVEYLNGVQGSEVQIPLTQTKRTAQPIGFEQFYLDFVNVKIHILKNIEHDPIYRSRVCLR